MKPDLEENLLFANVPIGAPIKYKPPLGGIHRDVIEATPHRKENLARWGMASTHRNSGWKSRAIAPCSATQIWERHVHSEIETIVSREVNGAYLTGSSDLDRDEVVAILTAQDYEQISDLILANQRIEKYRLRDPLVVPPAGGNMRDDC